MRLGTGTHFWARRCIMHECSTVGLLSTQVSDFPDLTLWTKSLTGHSARTWAHRVTPGSDEPGPFGRRAPRPAAAYPPRLPQDEQPHPPLPGADRGCRGHPGSGADAEPPGLGPARVVRTAPARRRCSRPRSASSSTSPRGKIFRICTETARPGRKTWVGRAAEPGP